MRTPTPPQLRPADPLLSSPLQREGMAASANNNRRATRAKSFAEPLPRETSWNPTVQHHPLPQQGGGWEGVTPALLLRRGSVFFGARYRANSRASLPSPCKGEDGRGSRPHRFSPARASSFPRGLRRRIMMEVPFPIIAPCRNKGGGGRFAKRRSGSPKKGASRAPAAAFFVSRPARSGSGDDTPHP